MKIFAISDPHLSFDTPGKKMDKFGEIWVNHPRKIKQNWERLVKDEDVVIVPGDISWAKKIDQAMGDLLWLDNLPGKKLILKGNHDLWWPKKKIMSERCPSTIYPIQNDSVVIGPFVFFGSRLWDTSEYSFNDIIEWDIEKGPLPRPLNERELEKQEKLYTRELERLRLSINSLPDNPELRRIGLCHYPPLSHDLQGSRASELFSNAGAEHVVFGHLHSLKKGPRYYGTLKDTEFHLTSCDFIDFSPKLICEG